MPGLVVTTRGGREMLIEGEAGLSVMQIIRAAGLDELLALCGGCCSCATCHVYVDEAFRTRMAPIGMEEDDLLDGSSHRIGGSRLACQIPFAPILDGLRVTIAPEDN